MKARPQACRGACEHSLWPRQALLHDAGVVLAASTIACLSVHICCGLGGRGLGGLALVAPPPHVQQQCTSKDGDCTSGTLTVSQLITDAWCL